jgi:hypothetical protein
MEAKKFLEPELAKGSLDVQGAFNAIWWPVILKALRDAEFPRNLYQLTQDYFRERRATLSFNGSILEKTITEGWPQRSCSVSGYWNTQYNSLLTLRYTKHAKAKAFADDVIIIIKADSIREAENITNVELSKISKLADDNKIKFNERKSKVMLLTRRKKRKTRN